MTLTLALILLIVALGVAIYFLAMGLKYRRRSMSVPIQKTVWARALTHNHCFKILPLSAYLS